MNCQPEYMDHRAGFARLRPLRRDAALRQHWAETPEPAAADFILPLFVVEGSGYCRCEVAGLDQVYHLSIAALLDEVQAALELGLRQFLLFGVIAQEKKDHCGSAAYDAAGDEALVPQAIRALKQRFGEYSDLRLIGDICLCGYTSHGHCGLLGQVAGRWQVDNDATLPHYTAMALAQAGAGVDAVAPSGMMDGQVLALRRGLDAAGYSSCQILAYSAKYASALYGPFRGAVGSVPQVSTAELGSAEPAERLAPNFELRHRQSYQLDCRNSDQALQEVLADLHEGADQVMVKPSLSYLDVIYRTAELLKQQDRAAGGQKTLVAYHVSGEYMMWRSAVKAGAVEPFASLREGFIALRRAGAAQIISYAASWYLNELGRR